MARLSAKWPPALRNERPGRGQTGYGSTGGTPSPPGHGRCWPLLRPEPRDWIGQPGGSDVTREGPGIRSGPADERQGSSELRRSPAGSAEMTKGQTELPRPNGRPGAWRVDGRRCRRQRRGLNGRGVRRRDAAVSDGQNQRPRGEGEGPHRSFRAASSTIRPFRLARNGARSVGTATLAR
jgi:hypothetical protein